MEKDIKQQLRKYLVGKEIKPNEDRADVIAELVTPFIIELLNKHATN